ncbi:hypothetical protein V9T40_000053 [Parthenolecanium corni]|uniref:Uncharacterized protein n=1 Tax=Parthenolecanium corni TaxID=536013 RepID=A0AAN9Y310_9HEMI
MQQTGRPMRTELSPKLWRDLSMSKWKEFVVQKLPYIDDQLPNDRCFLPSVVALNAIGLCFPKRVKNSNISFSPLSNINLFKLFSDDSKPTANSFLRASNPVQVEHSETEKAVIEMDIKFNEIQPRVERISSELEKARSTTGQLQKMVTEKLSRLSALERSLNLSPNSEENKEKLKNIIEKNKEKIRSLESQTNDRKLVLLKQLAEMQKIEEEKLVSASFKYCSCQTIVCHAKA